MTIGREWQAGYSAERILAANAVVECFMCDDDGYRGAQVCDHIDHAPAAARGMAKVRAVLAKRSGDGA